MKLHDSVIGVLLFAFGLWVLTTSLGYPRMPGQSIGPGTFPSALGALFMLGGIALTIGGLRTHRGPWLALESGWRQPGRLAAALLATAGVILLALGFERVGFPLGGFVLVTALFLLSGYRHPAWIGVSAAFVLALHLLMTRMLYVPLPAGLLKGLL
ncbi:tripartite tricarboxylate transporter TctB family protein [Aquibium sp. ELW1220]|uniref:tripartite tricarboxylate transporter TctB family protein n=1 Tax=Aquibium sp. ELW1220 TaxID=2976766 RepID=UPI0025AF2BC3|nr:tripartite tricarboxylate transporter TctB family protein [Aquibium sp. ELW1220]MDN2581510.1 tripartite tricarboxylate transporter TctB family protein [Aquibium sp. ELW1220]